MKAFWILILCVLLLFSGCTKVDDSADTTLPTTESTAPAETTEPTTEQTETEPPKVTINHPFTLEGEPLTREELDWFQNVFFTYTDTDALGNVTFNIRNMFLRAEFERPEEVDLGIVFREGVTRFSEVSQEEKDLYDKLTNNDSLLDYTKTPREDMERLFYENTGITVDQSEKIGLDKLVYLKEYDAYYVKKGDTGYTYWNMHEGVRMDDGTIVLLYSGKMDAQNHICKVTLAPHGDSYIFVANDRQGNP